MNTVIELCYKELTSRLAWAFSQTLCPANFNFSLLFICRSLLTFSERTETSAKNQISFAKDTSNVPVVETPPIEGRKTIIYNEEPYQQWKTIKHKHKHKQQTVKSKSKSKQGWNFLHFLKGSFRFGFSSFSPIFSRSWSSLSN